MFVLKLCDGRQWYATVQPGGKRKHAARPACGYSGTTMVISQHGAQPTRFAHEILKMPIIYSWWLMVPLIIWFHVKQPYKVYNVRKKGQSQCTLKHIAEATRRQTPEIPSAEGHAFRANGDDRQRHPWIWYGPIVIGYVSMMAVVGVRIVGGTLCIFVLKHWICWRPQKNPNTIAASSITLII